MSMEIGAYSALYNSGYTETKTSADKLQEKLGGDYSNATDEELMSVCKEFESYFVEQIFKEMRKSIPESEFTSSATKNQNDYYQDALYQEYAKSVSEQGDGLGLAQMLYEQMKRNYDL